MEAACVAFLQELDTIVPREEQFVEPLERLPPMAVRLSGLATSALAGGWPSDPQRRQLDDVQDWLFQLEDDVQLMAAVSPLSPARRCWEDGAAPCGRRFCLVCGDPLFRWSTRPFIAGSPN
eukprot:12121023-Heterocapsa_arctica.AAC.1